MNSITHPIGVQQALNNKYNITKELTILNFYSDSCPPCHAFMPNFIEAEKTYWEYFDFVAINSTNNMELSRKYRVMGTPTIIILKWDKIILNQSWVPNGAELKKIMIDLIWKEPEKIEVKKKKIFGLF